MAVEVKLPELSMTMHEAEIVEWLVAQGDVVEQGQPLVTVAVDKATLDLEAPEAGVISRILVPADAVVTAGALLVLISVADEPVMERAVEQAPASAPAPTVSRPAGKQRATGGKVSPLARKLAREHGLDIDQIEGTGPEGAVVVADVHRLLEVRDNQTPRG